MWTSILNQIDRQTTRTTLTENSRALSFGAVIELWQHNEEFRRFFTASISGCAFDAFFWETPPITEQTSDRPFESVLVEAASLSRLKPDPSPFVSHFSSQTSDEILTFPNLRGDAMLVVPKPVVAASCYTHLAAFLRSAPVSQVDALWSSAGRAMKDRISRAPTWLSTAGMSVSWLHLRLDSNPKYYRYAPYKIIA